MNTVESLLNYYLEHSTSEITPLALPRNEVVCLHKTTKCILVQESDFEFIKDQIPPDFLCAISPLSLSDLKRGPFVDTLDFFNYLPSKEDKIKFLERFKGSSEEIMFMMENLDHGQ